jgi:inositol 1,4,5-triphosphate receptor type 1/inositol 1,4,5-triphosphate receptor type 3
VIPKVSDTNKQLVSSKIRKLEAEDRPIGFNHRKRYRLPNIHETLTLLLNEYKYNLDTIDKAKSMKLGYFQPFQLIHVVSGRFLACHETESRFENQNYLIKLDDYTSDATVFNFAPAFRYQQDGE